MRRFVIVTSLAVALLAMTSTAWAAPLTQEPPGALDNFSQVIGALGLLAAMMAVLALGTEVVIDTLKLLLGFKRKPATLSALKELGDKLPGQLGDLGLTDEAGKKVSALAQQLGQVLQPVQQVQDFTEAAKNGDLKEAFRKADEFLHVTDSQQLATLQTAIGQQIRQGLGTILVRLQLPADQTQAILQAATSIAGTLDQTDVRPALLTGLRDTAAEIMQAWIKGQEQTLVLGGREAVRAAFQERVVPELQMLGLDDDAVEAIREQLNGTVNSLSSQASVYLESVRELVQAVETRRMEIQSPLRKVWRKLREWPILGNTTRWQDTKLLSWLRGHGLLTAVESLFNWVFQKQPESGKPGQPAQVPPLTATKLAGYLLESDDKQKDEEASRLRWLRVISAIVGIYLAYLLQVNAIDLVAGSAEIFKFLTKINAEIVTTERVLMWLNPPWLLWLLRTDHIIAVQPGLQLNAGILLSGLAASAGSAFWHDQLEKLQIAKKSVGQVEQLVATVKQPQGEQ